MRKFVALSMAVISILFGEDVDFETLEISADKLKSGESSFLKAGALSSRDDIKSQNQSVDSIVRALPGTYTQVDQAQGSVSVNIRGLTGLGRVDTMVDGVTQTYYGTAADSGGYHSFTGNLGTSAYGALIDQNLLVGIDVERGSFRGATNGIMGSANFRTIGVNDVVRQGNVFGFLGRYSYGTNGLGPSYMGALAAKDELESGTNIGALFAYSGKRSTQNYKDGNGVKSGDAAPDIDGDGVPDLSAPLDVDTLKQKPKSYLFKFEYGRDAHNAIASYRGHSNYLAKRKIKNNNYQLDYRFNPNSDFIDVKMKASVSDTTQKYDKDATIGWAPLQNGMKFKNKADILDLSNTFQFNPASANLKSTLGVNLLNNEYKRITGDSDYAGLKTSFSVPQGKQKLRSLYLDNSLEYGIFTLDANVNFMHWQLSGEKGVCSVYNNYCQPKEAGWMKKDGDELNYSLMNGVSLHEFFAPFIGYSKSTRALNVQELFHSGTVYEDINTFLQPETAKTFQLGFNSHKHGLIANDDVFGFKLTYYRSKVKNYIYDRLMLFYDDNGSPDTMYLTRLNGDATLRGFEIELMYDAGYFYTTATYSRQKASYPLSDSTAVDWTNGPSSGVSQFSELPKYYATIDAGVRFFDEKLTIGGIAKITGKAKRMNPLFTYTTNGAEFKSIKTQDLPSIPTIFDMYATYKPIENLTFKLEVQNVFDKNYMDALYTYNSSYSNQVFNDDITIFNNSARGRTALLSIEYRY